MGAIVRVLCVLVVCSATCCADQVTFILDGLHASNSYNIPDWAERHPVAFQFYQPATRYLGTFVDRQYNAQTDTFAGVVANIPALDKDQPYRVIVFSHDDQRFGGPYWYGWGGWGGEFWKGSILKRTYDCQGYSVEWHSGTWVIVED